MDWNTVQQLIRMAMYVVGTYLFGTDVADGETYQAAIGGTIALVAFVWWAYQEYKSKQVVTTDTPTPPA